MNTSKHNNLISNLELDDNSMNSYCVTCDKHVNGILSKSKEQLYVKDQLVKATIDIVTCPICGSQAYNTAVEKKNDIIVYDAYKIKTGLLTSGQMRAIIDAWDLPTAELSHAFGFEKDEFKRYIIGGIQDKRCDDLMRILGNLKEMEVIRAYAQKGGNDDD